MNINHTQLEILLDRIEKGESDLYLQVVQRFELMLRSYLAAQLYNSAEVDDLAQETFIAAYRDLSSFRRTEDFGVWLRGIARNRLLTHFRSVKRRANAIERFREEVSRIAEVEMEAAALIESDGRLEQLLHCISKLPEKLRRVVRSRLEGAQPTALAEELQVTVPAIYQLHYRANKMLRDCMYQKSVS